MIVRLRLGALAAALAFGGLWVGCTLGPKQDDPARVEGPVPDSGTGFATDSAFDAASPGSCSDDGSHVNEAGTRYDACPPSLDSGSFDAGADGMDGVVDGDATDAPDAIDAADAIDAGETNEGEASIVDDGTTGG